ncbi:hypothetical protein IAD21_03357 [Abditibacteriota bacterium]|nr:hypothetical protein IAD21_03357 [Abditibacteriota bacterium]
MAQTLERVETKLLGADEFMALPLEHIELVRGQVVHLVPPMFAHGMWVSNIVAALREWARRTGTGRVSTEASFRLSQNPDVVRAPDVCFVSHDRLEGQNLNSYIEGAPTLSVEIKSKHETLESLREKAAEYLQAGGLVVWIVQPGRRKVLVLSVDEGETTYRVGQSIPGGETLSGFYLPVADIFEEF